MDEVKAVEDIYQRIQDFFFQSQNFVCYIEDIKNLGWWQIVHVSNWLGVEA